jgi:spermidine/putrescine transport system substrate-binding protein
MSECSKNSTQGFSRRQVLSGVVACAAATLAGGAPRVGAASKIGGELRMIGWSDYLHPDDIAAFESTTGVKLVLETFDTNRDIYERLKLSNAEDSFDIGMNTDFFIQQLIDEKMIQKLDKARIPSFGNIAPAFAKPDYDPEGAYVVPKSVGYEGFIYDASVITRPMKTWGDFLDAMQDEASGRTTLLDGDEMGSAPLFWAKDISWNTQDEAALKEADDRVTALGKHVKAFKDWPQPELADGSVVLAQVWSGFGRYILDHVPNPHLTYVHPGPRSGVWVDNFHIPSTARNLDAAYAWLNFMLDPKTAEMETQFTNYHAPVSGIEKFLSAKDAQDSVIFPPADFIAHTERRVRNASYPRRMEIHEKFKNAAEM